MASQVLGIIDWRMTGDDQGNRTYTLKTLVECDDPLDDPAEVYFTPYLPGPGDHWNFGNGEDEYAYCSPGYNIEPVVSNEPNFFYIVTQKFSTESSRRNNSERVGNPLLEPVQVSGGTVDGSKPIYRDINGKAVLSSSHEPIYGLQQDDARPTITMSFNTASLIADAYDAIHCVNDSPMWGMDAGTIHLTGYSFSKEYMPSGYSYFKNDFTFEIKANGWALDDVLDAGYKVLDGKWILNNTTNKYEWIKNPNADPSKPNDFILNTDPKGNVVSSPTPLINGDRLEDPSNPQFLDPIEYMFPYNFASLGIPTSF